MEMEEEEAACEIARLPEELLSSRCSPSPGRGTRAADSDAVWSCFLPCDLPRLPRGELSRLLQPMWLDRENGAKCYMLSARAMHISWGGTPRYWRWIPLTDSRFKECAELINVCWLEICGKIPKKMLPTNTNYAAYLVYKIADRSYGFDFPFQEASVNVGGSITTHPHQSMWLDRETGFKCYMLSGRALQIAYLTRSWHWISLTGGSRFSEVAGLFRGYHLAMCGKVPCKMLSGNSNYAAYIVFVVAEDSHGLVSVQDVSVRVGGCQSTRQVCFHSTSLLGDDDDYYCEDEIEMPQERADGWMELELGEFYNEEGSNEGDEVCFSLVEPKGDKWLSKGGLIVQGIEIRPKKSGC
ncbi:hypothetical protein E2562_018528 [Oryza meyeriana var. granulata]|uniref:F-box domain-containing protein n=1 Tax=Oryza meyeriana var. granulata TaxID=110450 RepID=A0A6G1F990_9ORYZ|nr:hypothetical protein E2562_018528 [Oryza meyeriana var. granulata]